MLNNISCQQNFKMFVYRLYVFDWKVCILWNRNGKLSVQLLPWLCNCININIFFFFYTEFKIQSANCQTPFWNRPHHSYFCIMWDVQFWVDYQNKALHTYNICFAVFWWKFVNKYSYLYNIGTWSVVEVLKEIFIHIP